MQLASVAPNGRYNCRTCVFTIAYILRRLTCTNVYILQLFLVLWDSIVHVKNNTEWRANTMRVRRLHITHNTICASAHCFPYFISRLYYIYTFMYDSSFTVCAFAASKNFSGETEICDCDTRASIPCVAFVYACTLNLDLNRRQVNLH